MAKAEFISKRPARLIAGKKTLKSSFFVLEIFSFTTVVAALTVAAGIGICQHAPNEVLSRGGALADETWCDDLDILVISHDPHDTMIVCEGARDAVVFLESHGLDVSGEIVIELRTELLEVVSRSAAGCYIESERRVLILVYSAFKKFKTWFGIPIDRSLFRSVVSHEVAHLVADFNFTISKPLIQAKEYIAYITQFSTMEPKLRERVLSNFPYKAFENDWQMSTTIYMLDCMSFGARAYLHFIRLTDGNEYLHAILNGEALIE